MEVSDDLQDPLTDSAKVLQKLFQCGLCSITFELNPDLVSHVAHHSLTKPFQCAVCKVSYDTNPELTSHVRVHEVYLFVPENVLEGGDATSVIEAADVKPRIGTRSAAKKQDKTSPAKKTEDSGGKEVKRELFQDDSDGDDVVEELDYDTSDDYKPEIAVKSTQGLKMTTRKSARFGSIVEAKGKGKTPVKSIQQAKKDVPQKGKKSAPKGQKSTKKDASDLGAKDENLEDVVAEAMDAVSEALEMKDEDSKAVKVEADEEPMVESTENSPVRQSSRLAIKKEGTGKKARPSKKRKLLASLNLVGKKDVPVAVKLAEKKKKEALASSEEKKSFTCETCGKVFFSVSVLKRHLHMHKTGSLSGYRCQVCHKNFPTKAELATHEEENYCADSSQARLVTYERENNITRSSFPMPCPEPDCKSHIVSRNYFRKHMKEKHWKVKQVFCEFCGKAFSRMEGLVLHRNTHLDVKAFSCETCDAGYSSLKGLKSHLKTGRCGKRKHDKEKFRTVEGTFPGTCKECGRKIKSYSSMRKHITEVHEKIKSHFCEICGKGFARSNYLKFHRNTHTGTCPFKCDLCNKGFRSRPALNVHTKRGKCLEDLEKGKTTRKYETVEGTFPGRCKECNRMISNKQNLRKHIEAVHLKLKRHFCEFCAKGFSRYNELQSHRNTHTGAKPHKCEKCDIGFNSRTAYRLHVQRNHQERQFVCQHCGSAFHSAPVLASHIATHSKERKFACEICGKSFRLARYLKRHENAKHSMKEGGEQRQVHVTVSTAKKRPAKYIVATEQPKYIVTTEPPDGTSDDTQYQTQYVAVVAPDQDEDSAVVEPGEVQAIKEENQDVMLAYAEHAAEPADVKPVVYCTDAEGNIIESAVADDSALALAEGASVVTTESGDVKPGSIVLYADGDELNMPVENIAQNITVSYNEQGDVVLRLQLS